MSAIKWNSGEPPDNQRGKRLLLIGRPIRPAGGVYDAAADQRPEIFIGHYKKYERGYIAAQVLGTLEREERSKLNVQYWAEINLPDGVQLRALGNLD